MSNFVDRLITRGAGLSIGLPLLKPRPAARFEPEAGSSIEVETPAEASWGTASGSTPMPGEVRLAPTRAEAARPRVPDRQFAREGDIVEAEVLSSQPRSHLSQTRPLPGMETAQRPAADLEEGARISVPEPSMSRQSPLEHQEAPHRRPRMFFDAPPVNPAIRPAPPAEPESAAPAISIGRIDVQFLPQETPALPQRPEPQRTRGFEAYARARRGEPR